MEKQNQKELQDHFQDVEIQEQPKISDERTVSNNNYSDPERQGPPALLVVFGLTVAVTALVVGSIALAKINDLNYTLEHGYGGMSSDSTNVLLGNQTGDVGATTTLNTSQLLISSFHACNTSVLLTSVFYMVLYKNIGNGEIGATRHFETNQSTGWMFEPTNCPDTNYTTSTDPCHYIVNEGDESRLAHPLHDPNFPVKILTTAANIPKQLEDHWVIDQVGENITLFNAYSGRFLLACNPAWGDFCETLKFITRGLPVFGGKERFWSFECVNTN